MNVKPKHECPGQWADGVCIAIADQNGPVLLYCILPFPQGSLSVAYSEALSVQEVLRKKPMSKVRKRRRNITVENGGADRWGRQFHKRGTNKQGSWIESWQSCQKAPPTRLSNRSRRRRAVSF